MRLGPSALCATVFAGVIALTSTILAQSSSATYGSARSDYEQRAVRRSSDNMDYGMSNSGPYRTVWAPGRMAAYQKNAAPNLVEPTPVPVPDTSSQGMLMDPVPGESYEMDQTGMVTGGCQSCGDGDSCDGGNCCAQGGDTWCGCEDGFVRPLGPLCLPWIRNMSVFFGVHGFKNVADVGRNGNFGIHEGLNWGGPLGQVLLGDGIREIGWQVGIEGTQSNLSDRQGSYSDLPSGEIPGSDRNQVFLTGGLFKRATCGGLQWGIVYDYLHDQYWVKADLRQLRAEVSLANPCWGEFGFWGTFSMAGKDVYKDSTETDSVEPLDMYTLFLRRYFTNGGEGRIWGGGTANGDGLVGADLEVPLGPAFSLVNDFNYMIPRKGGDLGQADESWSVNLQLVWYPGRRAMCAQRDPFRPLLPVANNTYFVLEQRQRNH